MTDLEMDAMMSINSSLRELDPEAAARVLRWAADKFATTAVLPPAPGQEGVLRDAGESARDSASYSEIADLVAAADPRTDVERALVGTYWFQVIKGDQSVTSQAVNAELKQLGYGAKNITDAFSGLIERKPQWALQVAKSGTSRQARKKYRLTDVGVKQVERMTSKASSDEE